MNQETQPKPQYLEQLEKIFPRSKGFTVTSTVGNAYHIETSREGIIGEQLQEVTKLPLYLSQIIESQKHNRMGIKILLLDLTKVDSHYAFYGYRFDKAQGHCLICGEQTKDCGHEYVTASPKIRNCHVCEWHEFCKMCYNETCGSDMCIGDICASCYKKTHRDDY